MFKLNEDLLKFKENRQIQEEIREIDEQKDLLHERRQELKSKIRFKCPRCKKRSMIKNTDAISKHHYVKPHGCTGGDYWVFSDIGIICPKCQLEFRPQIKEKDFWISLRSFFKSLTDDRKR